MTTAVATSRKLSLFERWFYERNKQIVYSNFFVAGVYSKLDATRLSNALRHVLLVYPQFSCNVFGDEAKALEFKTIPKILFEDVVEFISVPELELESIKLNESVCQRIINRTFEFNVDRPLWRLLIINNETVVFYCDHVILDGNSGANFHLILLDHLNKLQGIELTKLDVLYDSSVDKVEKSFPAVNDHIFKPSVQVIASALYQEFAPKLIKDTLSYLQNIIAPDNSGLVGQHFQGKAVLKAKDFAINTTFIKIPSEILKTLLSVCKQHKVLLTALIIYITNASILHIVNGKDLLIGFPIGTRGKLPTSNNTDETFGLFIKGGAFTIPSVNELSVDWDNVARIHAKILDQVNSKSTLEMVGMLAYVDLESYLSNKLGKPFEDTLQISNLGLQRPDDSGPIRITDMYFNQCIGPGGGYVNMSIVSTAKGGMNIGFTYHPDEHEELLDCLERIEKRLHLIASTE